MNTMWEVNLGSGVLCFKSQSIYPDLLPLNFYTVATAIHISWIEKDIASKHNSDGRAAVLHEVLSDPL